MNWYLKYKIASPKNQISKFQITEPSLILFIYKYEKVIPWVEMTSKDDIISYINEKLLPNLFSRIDPNAPINNYSKDVDLEGEFNAHPNDPEVQRARAIYEKDPAGAKAMILEKTNKDKQNAFELWKEYLTEISDITKSDPAFIYAMFKTIIDSSPETQTTPVIVLDAEALAELYQKIQDTGGKQDFNLLKAYKKSWDNAQKQTDHFRPTNSKSDGWMRIPSKKNDPDNYEKNKDRLKGYASGQGWCIAGEVYANQYLSGGDFYLFLEDGTAVVAIRFSGSKIAEIRGKDNKDPHYYSKQVISFIEENNFELSGPDSQGYESAAIKTFNALKEGKEINDKFENDEVFRQEYLEEIKHNILKYDMLYEHNRSRPDVRKALVDFWNEELLKNPQNYYRCPEDIKKFIPEETELYIVDYWINRLPSVIYVYDHYDFPRDLMKKHKKLFDAVSEHSTKRIMNKPWELSELSEDITNTVREDVKLMAQSDRTYELFEELKKSDINPEELAERYGFYSELLDAGESGELGDYDEPSEAWDSYLNDDGVLDLKDFEYFGNEERLAAVIKAIGQSWYDYISNNPERIEEFNNLDNNDRYEGYRDSYDIYEAERNGWSNLIQENPRKLNDAPYDVIEYEYNEEEGIDYYVNLWVSKVKSGDETFEDAYNFLDDYPEMQESFFNIFVSDAQLSSEYILGAMTSNPHFLFDNVEKLLTKSNIIWTHSDEVKNIIDTYLSEKPDGINFIFSQVIEAISLEDDDFFSEEEMSKYMELYRQYHINRIGENPWRFHEIDLRMQNDPDIINMFHNKEKWIKLIYTNGIEAFKKAPKHIQEDQDAIDALEKYNIIYDLKYPSSRGPEKMFETINMYDNYEEKLGRFAQDQEFRQNAYNQAKEGYLHTISMAYNPDEYFIFKRIPEVFRGDIDVINSVSKQISNKLRWDREIDLNEIDPIIVKNLNSFEIDDLILNIIKSKNPSFLSNYIEQSEKYRDSSEYNKIYNEIKKKFIEFLNSDYSPLYTSALYLYPDIFVNDIEVLQAAREALQQEKDVLRSYNGEYPDVVKNLITDRNASNLFGWHKISNWYKISKSKFHYIGQCNNLRLSDIGKLNWEKMMNNRISVPVQELINNCDVSAILDDDDSLEDWGLDDSNSGAYRSVWGYDACYFFQTSGFEFIWKE